MYDVRNTATTVNHTSTGAYRPTCRYRRVQASTASAAPCTAEPQRPPSPPSTAAAAAAAAAAAGLAVVGLGIPDPACVLTKAGECSSTCGVACGVAQQRRGLKGRLCRGTMQPSHLHPVPASSQAPVPPQRPRRHHRTATGAGRSA